MGWFTNAFTAPPDKPKNVIRVIYEDTGRYVLDKDYTDMGESEGWLEYTGYRYEGNDFIMTFAHII